MSNVTRDPNRKVSAPSNEDFFHGFATDAEKRKKKQQGLLALAAGYLLGKYLRR